jgi:hypothetical protein
MDGVNCGCMICRRNRQRPAGRFVVVDAVFNALTGQHQTPIHRLPPGAGGNHGIKQCGRRLHSGSLNAKPTPGKRTADS